MTSIKYYICVQFLIDNDTNDGKKLSKNCLFYSSYLFNFFIENKNTQISLVIFCSTQEKIYYNYLQLNYSVNR